MSCCADSYNNIPCCCSTYITTTTTCPFGICCEPACENGTPCLDISSTDCVFYNGPILELECIDLTIFPGDNYTQILESIISNLPICTFLKPTTTTTTTTTSSTTSTSTTTSTTTVTPDPVCVETQGWSLANLNVTTYANGDPIPEVQDQATWESLTTGAWCSYNNNPANDAIYGKLYNWYAVNDPRGLAPTGYHTPSDTEWTTLINCLGGDSVAGGKMKEVGTTNWLAPNTGATNSSGFTALPGGLRYPNFLAFQSIGDYAEFWTSLSIDLTTALAFVMSSSNTIVGQSLSDKKAGRSVRVVAD